MREWLVIAALHNLHNNLFGTEGRGRGAAGEQLKAGSVILGDAGRDGMGANK